MATNLNCPNGIITDNLLGYIDISQIKSWDLNSNYIVLSLMKWKNSISSNTKLPDYGLTGFDNGRVNKMYSGITLTNDDNRLKLYRVGYNNFTGGTFYDTYPINSVTGNTSVGNFFKLNGGYLQGEFKLQDVDYETIPPRFNNGFTMETLINLSGSTGGIFFYMGARASDKYNQPFSGETMFDGTNIPITDDKYDMSLTNVTFTGVTDSNGNYLHSFLVEPKVVGAFSDFENEYVDVYNEYKNIHNVMGNVIAFFIDQNNCLGYKYIDTNGNIREDISSKSINTNGWVIINVSFKPNQIIQNYDSSKYMCYPRRNGTLYFYVNGRLFWKVDDFEEFYFSDFYNSNTKVLGVPYNISWGGGSFGLKHSWHYDINTNYIYNGESNYYVINNIIPKINPYDDDDCFIKLSGNTYNENLEITVNNTTFVEVDACDPNITTPVSTIQLTSSAETTTSRYYIEYLPLVNILSNRQYVLSTDVYLDNVFINNAINNLGLVVYGDNDIEIISETIYSSIPGNVSGVTTLNQNNVWLNLKVEFQASSEKPISNVNFGLFIESDKPLNPDFFIYIKDWKWVGRDKLVQNPLNTNDIIQQNFDNSFNGSIQKLRLYDKFFSPQEALYNALYESMNKGYNLNVTNGGRLIFI